VADRGCAAISHFDTFLQYFIDLYGGWLLRRSGAAAISHFDTFYMTLISDSW